MHSSVGMGRSERRQECGWSIRSAWEGERLFCSGLRLAFCGPKTAPTVLMDEEGVQASVSTQSNPFTALWALFFLLRCGSRADAGWCVGVGNLQSFSKGHQCGRTGSGWVPRPTVAQRREPPDDRIVELRFSYSRLPSEPIKSHFVPPSLNNYL